MIVWISFVANASLAHQHETDELFFFDIPSQRADLALVQFAEQADLTFVFPYEEAKKETAGRLYGEYAINAALFVLLDGTSLRPEKNRSRKSGSIKIRHVKAQREGAMEKKSFLFGLLAGASSLAIGGGGAAAQEDARIDSIVVTATKKQTGEDVQDVPIAMTAFGEKQLDDLNYRNLESLSFTVPNVQLEPIGSAAGHQNFSIRGLSITSSIPSLDPPVGVFVDGIYQGFGGGVVLDSFDLEAVEILRGPQGVLFGRNVTGGAIIVRTRRPSFETAGEAGARIETGLQYTFDGSITGALIDDKLAGKMAIYANRDEGYFRNLVTGNKFSPSDTWIARPSLLYSANDNLEILMRAEIGDRDGAGAVYQNTGAYDRDSFDIGVDEEGESRQRWVSASMEVNLDVPFGDGVITNIFGFRDYESFDFFDVDGFDASTFNAVFDTEQRQISNELRYSGRFDFVELTAGLYYFDQDINYVEERFLFGATTPISGGGVQDQYTFGAFGAADVAVIEPLTLNLGVRYTKEKKDVQISRIRDGGCNEARTACAFTFADDETWNNVSPRAGLQYEPSPNLQFFGYWAQGFRSGGYNLRLTSDLASPGPVDSEKQNSYEAGFKADLLDGTLRLNASAFRNKIIGVQREITQVTIAGPSQRLTNVGDVIIKGFEGELQYSPLEGLVFSAFGGHLDAEFSKIDFDLTGDSVIDDADFALEPPRTAPWTYGFGANYQTELTGGWSLTGNINFSHRDEVFATDSNNAVLWAVDNLDMNIAVGPASGAWQIAFYGLNMLNESTFAGNAAYPDIPEFGGDGPAGPRPSPDGGTQKKGRILGGELRFRF